MGQALEGPPLVNVPLVLRVSGKVSECFSHRLNARSLAQATVRTP